ncbi:MAG: hypothetical protein HQL24_02285 [Candidatus Omnitrophica bacterium]|nr:hypothetical protein [Candidatus Omnitrophota bacterium]
MKKLKSFLFGVFVFALGIFLGILYTERHISLDNALPVHFIHKHYDKSGKLVSSGSVFNEVDVLTTREWYYPNGKARYIEKKFPKADITRFTEYYENGDIKAEGMMEDGLLTGTYVFYPQNNPSSLTNAKGEKVGAVGYEFPYYKGVWLPLVERLGRQVPADKFNNFKSDIDTTSNTKITETGPVYEMTKMHTIETKIARKQEFKQGRLVYWADYAPDGKLLFEEHYPLVPSISFSGIENKLHYTKEVSGGNVKYDVVTPNPQPSDHLPINYFVFRNNDIERTDSK